MKVSPQISKALLGYEQDVVFKHVIQTVENYLPAISYTEKSASAVIQNAKSQKLSSVETDASIRYIKVLSRADYPLGINDLVSYEGIDYKVISLDSWSDYGFYRAVCEEYTHVQARLDVYQIAVCNYVCALLPSDPQRTVFGRSNYYRINQADDYIAIDETDVKIEGHSKDYDNLDEIASYSAVVKANYTISFYGVAARRKAFDFINMQKTQHGYECQSKYNLGVGSITAPQNFIIQDGTQYRNCWQTNIVCKYTDTLSVELLRIDSPQTKVLTYK